MIYFIEERNFLRVSLHKVFYAFNTLSWFKYQRKAQDHFFTNLPETIAITSQAVFHLASSSAFCPLSISKILPKAASMLAFSPETFEEATEWTSGDDNYDRVSWQLRLSSLFSSWSPGWSNPPPPQMATATWEGEIFLRTVVPLTTIASLIANSATPLKAKKHTKNVNVNRLDISYDENLNNVWCLIIANDPFNHLQETETPQGRESPGENVQKGDLSFEQIIREAVL